MNNGQVRQNIVGVNILLTYFNYFLTYSFLGFLLETVFSFFVKGRLESRKCFLISALCPVYGLGAIAINESTKKISYSKTKTFFVGMLAATTVELFTDLFYKYVLGMRFWDYSKRPFNLWGSVCLKYSLSWGLLSLLLVYVVHPYVNKHIGKVKKGTSYAFMLLFISDSIISAFLLRKFRTKHAVNYAWIRKAIRSSWHA